MASPGDGYRVIRFGAFELDVQSGELRKQGLKTRLPPQSFQVLVVLLEHRGEVVTREALRHELWPADTFVDFDMGLSSAVKKLREALGDSAENPRFVETLPRRGYRFIAGVDEPVRPDPPASPPDAPVHRRSWRGGVAMAAAMAAVALGRKDEPPAADGATDARAATIGSLAVLPLDNLSGDPSQDYFADGMTDALITELARIGRLRVISRSSVMHYRTTRKLLREIARELNVDAVVEGTVLRVGDRIRITAQLVHAPTERPLWARGYERGQRDVLALQAEVARDVARAVRAEVRPGERSTLSRASAVDVDAYEAYLKGRYYWNIRGRDNLLKAAGYFQEASRADPSYAPAYAGLSDTYRLFDLYGTPPAECMPKAEAAARQALALDDALSEAHASLAGVLYRYHWDWSGAEREFTRSLELDPNSAEGHRAYAIYLSTVRRDEDALRELRHSQGLNPLSPVVSVEVANALTRVGRYDEAAAELQRTRELDPGSARIGPTLAVLLLRQGELSRAIDAFGPTPSGGGPAAASPWLGYLYGATGRRAEAMTALRALEKRSREQYVSPQHLATVHLGLGHRDEAFRYLEKAYQERAIEVLGFSGPLFDLLHDDPRYRDLVGRMGLGDAYYPAAAR